MKLLAHSTTVAVGFCSLLIPSFGILVAAGYTSSSDFLGLVLFSVVLVITLCGVGYLSWACVRHGGMSVKVAAVLPVVPFIGMSALTLPALALGAIAPVFIWAVPLTIALVIGRRAALFAQSSITKIAEQDGADQPAATV